MGCGWGLSRQDTFCRRCRGSMATESSRRPRLNRTPTAVRSPTCSTRWSRCRFVQKNLANCHGIMPNALCEPRPNSPMFRWWCLCAQISMAVLCMPGLLVLHESAPRCHREWHNRGRGVAMVVGICNSVWLVGGLRQERLQDAERSVRLLTEQVSWQVPKPLSAQTQGTHPHNLNAPAINKLIGLGHVTLRRV